MAASPELKRSLSTRHIWCLALGAMIGFGCFVLPGNAFLPEAGPLGAALGLLLGAGMIMVISLSFSYLIRQLPHGGGSFLYAAALFGKSHGFILGWFLILTYWALVPLNATAIGLIGRNLFPGLLQTGYLYTLAGYDVYLGEVAAAVAVLLLIGFINLRGGRSAGWMQTAVTFGSAGSVLLIGVGVLLTHPDPANLQPPFPQGISGFQAVFAIVAMTPWAFLGFDCIPQAAEEFNFPPRQTLRIMLSAILLAALMYITVNTATAAVRPWQEILTESWATGAAVKAALGHAGLLLIGLAMVCAVCSAMNAFLLSSSRLVYAMSQADALPARLGQVDARTGTPRNAILFLILAALGAPLLGRQVINWVVDMTSVGASLSFAYTCAAAARLARRRKETRWQIIGWIGFVLSLLFLSLLLLPGSPGFLSVPSLCALGVWALTGLAFYHFVAKRYQTSPRLDKLLETFRQQGGIS